MRERLEGPAHHDAALSIHTWTRSMNQHKLRDGVCLRERVGERCDYEAARLAMAGGLLQSVRCVLWMVQQADGAGD